MHISFKVTKSMNKLLDLIIDLECKTKNIQFPRTSTSVQQLTTINFGKDVLYLKEQYK